MQRAIKLIKYLMENRKKIILLLLLLTVIVYYYYTKKSGTKLTNPFSGDIINENEERRNENPAGDRSDPFDSTKTETRNNDVIVIVAENGTVTETTRETNNGETNTTGTTRHDKEGKRTFVIKQ